MNAARIMAGFAKAQVSAFLGGVVDYSVMILFVQLFHIHYTIAIIAGGIVGAAVNFAINRYWSFYSPGGATAIRSPSRA
ncbi:MAG: GtrA family protein [Rectinema subterraneum]|uniref:GtrA family protein n=1 Tax=Rectinema subterraneum TaxID=2653714 RepID=UPI003C7BFF2A